MQSSIVKCPFPFPDFETTTKVEIYQEVDTEDQGTEEHLIFDGLAIYDESSRNVFSADSKQIALSGKLIIKGDVQTLESTKAFQGFVKIGKEKKRIYKCSRPKIFGVVYSTEVELQ